MKLSPPMPEVQYLPAIFRRIQNGDIRIPAFQRTFVWNDLQVLQLLESLWRGFPIGSILFWRVDERILKVESSVTSVFPNIDEKYPLSYVLDGVQRLCTLYSCFHYKDNDQENIFNVIFNLDDAQFYHYKDKAQSLPPHYIHLSKIFNPKEFLEAQRLFSQDTSADRLLDIAIKLHSTFQEYLLPTVTITNRSVDEVVDIFSRINSTGTRLDPVDFLRAAIWSEQFDLNDALDSISTAAKELGFDISNETIAKVIAICAGKNPTSQSMLELRGSKVAILTASVEKAKDVLSKVFEFLKTECLIFSNDFVPYEGQLLILVKYILETGTSYSMYLDDMRRWFRSVSFNESYRGKPDSYIVHDLKQLEQFIHENGAPLSVKVNIAASDFYQRVFVRNKALSAAVANLFAANRARSIFTGELIPAESFMSDFSARNYGFIVSLRDMQTLVGFTNLNNRALANIVVVTEDEFRELRSISIIDVLKNLVSNNKPDVVKETLDSQMLSYKDIKYLESKQFDEFLELRATEMYSKVTDSINR